MQRKAYKPEVYPRMTQQELGRCAELTEKRAAGGLTPGETRERNHLCAMFHAQEHAEVAATAPPIAGAADVEYNSRIEAQRITAEFRTKSTRRVDAGRKPIDESPLWGGPKQQELF